MSNCNIDNSYQKLDTKAIKQRAKSLLKEGLSKQEAFAILKAEFHHSKYIAKILKCTPSNKQKTKYKVWNYLLIFTLLPSFVVLLLNFTYSSLGGIVLYGLFFYAIITTKPRVYIGITAYMFISIFVHLLLYFTQTNNNAGLIFSLMITNSIALVLSYRLNQMFCPEVEEKREQYIDKEGLTRVRIIYTFVD